MDSKRREELKRFIEDYNKRYGTKFKSTGVKGSEHRESSTRHRDFGAIDVGAGSRSKEGRKKSWQFINEMAKRGFTVIDERDAPSQRTGKNNRNVIHVDSFTKDRDSEAWDTRGTIRREKPGHKYPIIGRQSQIYNNPIPKKQQEELDRMVARESAEYKEKAENIDSFMADLTKNTTDEVASRDLGKPNNKEVKDKLLADRGMSLNDMLKYYASADTNKSNEQLKQEREAFEAEVSQPQEAKNLVAMNGINYMTGAGPAPKTPEEEGEEKILKKKQEVIAKSEQTIQENPDAIEEVVKQTTGDAQVASNVKKDIKAKNQGKKRDPITSQFTDALTFFLPSIIGGIGGALFEGTEGAIAGATEGERLGKSYRDFQMEQQRLAATQQQMGARQNDVKTFVDSKTGKPVRADLRTGKFFDLSSGKEVNADSVTQAVTYRQNRSLDQRQSEQSDTMKRFNLKSSQLSDKQVNEIQGITKSESALMRVSSIMDKVDTGPIASKWQSLLEKGDFASEDFVTMKQEVSTLNNDYIKMITGAQMSEPEAERIMKAMPSMDDDDKTFKVKVKTLKGILKSHQQAFADAIATGQPLRGSNAEKLISKKMDEFDKKVSKVSASPKRTRADYEAAIRNAKSVEEIEKLKKQFGVRQ